MFRKNVVIFTTFSLRRKYLCNNALKINKVILALRKLCYNDVMVKRQNVEKNADDSAVSTSGGSLRDNQKKKWHWFKRDTRRGKHPMPAVLRVSCAILFLMIMSIFLTWFMIWRTNLCDIGDTMEFLEKKPMLVVYNYVVIFGVLAILAAATWRPFLSTGIMFSGLAIISFIYIAKYEIRAEPLLPEEFALIDSTGDLIKFVDGDAIARLIWGVIFMLVGSALLEYYGRKLIGRDTRRLPWWDRISLIPRVTFTSIALALLMTTVRPILQRNNYGWLDKLELIAWNQTENYEKNGFIIGFLYNLGKVKIDEPEDYSESQMIEIAEKYQAIKAQDDKQRIALDDGVENIIVILAETFYDPALLEEYYPHTGGDVTPNLHKIFQNYPSGYMYSPEYGGGTANVEFEVQTGLSNFWARTFPYVNLVSKMDTLYGVAQWGKSFGFDTTALHSYSGSVYKRNIVYPKIGYDEFIDEDEMTYTEHENSSSVINDKSIYQEVLDLLENNDSPQIIGIATMQNHAPFNQAGYPELEFRQTLPHDENWALEASYQSLHESDAYLGEFLNAIDKLKEKTVVLWFGDHAMGMLDEYSKSEDKQERDIAHLTPYFVYANFDIDEKNVKKIMSETTVDETLAEAYDDIKGVNLPTTTPNCLQNMMYDVLNLQKPAFFYIVENVCKTNPVLTHSYLAGNSPVANDALKEYELVNYDLLVGKQYWDGR